MRPTDEFWQAVREMFSPEFFLIWMVTSALLASFWMASAAQDPTIEHGWTVGCNCLLICWLPSRAIILIHEIVGDLRKIFRRKRGV